MGALWAFLVVSILTGLERPVQHPASWRSWSVRSTFQSSPALKDRCNAWPSSSGCIYPERFQSSPALKDRCNRRYGADAAKEIMFQSSPALKDRCNAYLSAWADELPGVSILTGLERPVQLARALRPCETDEVFQSSPALKDRCNAARRSKYSTSSSVSILTGLERPVQLRVTFLSEPPVEFQSSPALKDRCNDGPGQAHIPEG